MSITARQLNKPYKKELESLVCEHLQIIDDKLIKSEKILGKNHIEHDLPINILVIGLDKKNAQRIIYATIIRSLEKRGFKTNIILEENKTTLIVKWKSEFNSKEIESMNSLLKSKIISRESLTKNN